MNRRAILIVILVIGGMGGLGLVWWLASPLFLNRAVNEEFPVVIEDGRLVSPAAEELTAMSPEEIGAVQEQADQAAASMPDTVMEEPMPEMGDDPVIVAQGSFMGADAFHQGTGTATIYELPDGARVLRFQNFEVTNGPDLHVFVSGHPAPAGHADVMVTPSLDLGMLKGNLGDQNYEIPADVDVSGIQSITIYCVPFQVIFATASLAP